MFPLKRTYALIFRQRGRPSIRKHLFVCMDLSKNGELLESVLNQLIDEESLGVCFEMHRAVKLNYYELLYPDDR